MATVHAMLRMPCLEPVAMMKMRLPPSVPPQNQGFTLVEAIIVIVVTAILVGIVTMFMRLPFFAYVDTAARAELVDAADTSLRRIARDVRLSLPNSVRLSADGRYLELLLTKTGGRYLQDDDGLAGNPLQFDMPTLNCVSTPADPACSFSVVGNMPQAPQNIAVNDKIVVYNLGLGAADAYSGGNLANVRQVNGNLISLSTNPFALQSPAMRSPTRRFQVVSTPVTYHCDPLDAPGGKGLLQRYAGYPISALQMTPPTGSGLQTSLLADGVQSCKFEYSSVANLHTGLVGLQLSLKRSGKDAGVVTLYHQVHVDNTP